MEKVVLAYDFDSLIVEIGSSLGLWLGLSIAGMFDILILTGFTTQKILQGNYQILNNPTTSEKKKKKEMITRSSAKKKTITRRGFNFANE